MQLLPHAAVPISIPYRLGPNSLQTPPSLEQEANSKHENGFYEALAAVFVDLFSFVDTSQEEVSEGVRRLVQSVENAFVEYGLPNHARSKELAEHKINATAQALRKCVMAYLDKHIDALVHHSRATKDNCDSLFHMYDALHPRWRHSRRYTQGRDAPEPTDGAYREGVRSLLEAAQMYIQRRTQARKGVSYLEANISAHIFSAFIYLYEGEESPAGAPARIYGPDVATFSSANNLARIAIFVDQRDGTHRFGYGVDDAWIHERGTHAVLPQHEGAEPRGAREAFEKRVRIVGGSTPYLEATRANSDETESGEQEVVNLITRGATFLRPLQPVQGATNQTNREEGIKRFALSNPSESMQALAESALERLKVIKEEGAWLAKRQEAYAAWEAENKTAAKNAKIARQTQKDEWRKAAASEQQKRAARSRRVNGKQILGGYPHSRASEVPATPPPPPTWAELSDEALDRANQKLTSYGKMMDAKRGPKQRFSSKYAASNWQLRYVWPNEGLTDAAKEERARVLKAAQDKMARRVWHDAHAVQRVQLVPTQNEERKWRVDGLPKYKRTIKPRSTEEVASLANRRMLVSQWMQGYMQQPVKLDGTPRDGADALRCQAAQHFINNFSILDHPNLKYVLSQCDDAEQQALEDEYADFMAAERRLLMNVLRRVGNRRTEEKLIKAYQADAASFAWCNNNDAPDVVTAAAKTTGAAPGASPAGLTAGVQGPSSFYRKMKEDPDEAVNFATSSQEQRWMRKTRPEKNVSETNNYNAQNASALMTEMKSFRDKDKEDKVGEGQGRWPNVGNVVRRKYLEWHIGPHESMDMPQKTDENYNAALVRMLEFLDQLHPVEQPRYCRNMKLTTTPAKRKKSKKGKPFSGDGSSNENEETDIHVWIWNDAALQDPLICGGNGKTCVDFVKVKNDSNWSPFVQEGASLLESVIRRYIEHARANNDVFESQDPEIWGHKGKTVEQSDGKGLTKAFTMVSAFWTELLSCFPKKDLAEGKLNSIMSFVRWYYQHVWTTYDKHLYRQNLCQIVGVPNVNSWVAKSRQDWGDGGYEHELRKKIVNYLDVLWTAVSFTKCALDFAVVDHESPLLHESYHHILQEWVQTHTIGPPLLLVPTPAPEPEPAPAPEPEPGPAIRRRRLFKIPPDNDSSDDNSKMDVENPALDGGLDA
ncbi:MAG: hypothetical protein CMI29_06705 [Opitutae bacterium]|nr:hypothetical protein [Opitutae bacterium]